jgi:hypothetical protein
MKTLFFFIVLSLSLTLNAQLTKGNWLVGGTANFETSTSIVENNAGSESKSTSIGFQLLPNLGYFIAKRFAVGLDISVFFGNPEGSNNSNWNLGGGPFIRYYFLENDNLINIFGETYFTYSSGFSDRNNNTKSTTLGFSSGGVLFFNSSVGLELSLNYVTSATERNNGRDSKWNRFFLGLGFQIHLEK